MTLEAVRAVTLISLPTSWASDCGFHRLLDTHHGYVCYDGAILRHAGDERKPDEVKAVGEHLLKCWDPLNAEPFRPDLLKGLAEALDEEALALGHS